MACPHRPSTASALRRMRARRLQRNHRGVAAVIGTLLALLVFMTLFGIFLTQFLPIWMTDNEAALATSDETQLADVKACMDQLALEKTSTTCTQPVTLLSGSVPVFAAPTQATIGFVQKNNLWMNVSFNLTALGASTTHGNYYQNVTPNEIFMVLPDRYYVPLQYQLYAGGLISTQGGPTQNMLFFPSISATTSGTSTALSMTVYEMFGNGTTISSGATAEVYVAYAGSDSFTTTNTAVNMTLASYYPCAWQEFFKSALTGSSELPLYRPAGCPANIPTGQVFVMKAYFPTVSSFTLNIVQFTVSMGLGNP